MTKFNLTWSGPISDWRLGNPQPLADTLRAYDKPIPPEVRDFLADALLSGPKKRHGRRIYERSDLNYMYEVATILEAAKTAREPESTIRRLEGEAVEAVVTTTGAQASAVKKKIQQLRRQLRGSPYLELRAALFDRPATVRRHVSGKDVRPKPVSRNLQRIPNSVFALGLEGDVIGP